HQPDEKRLAVGELVEGGDGGAVVFEVPLHQEKDDTSGDQRIAHHRGVKETLYVVVQEKPESAGGNECDDDLQPQIGALQEPFSVQDGDRQHGAQLDDHLEDHMEVGLDEFHQLGGEDEVAGRGYGEKL